MKNETIWTWIQNGGKCYKVISDPNQGTIEVINEKGETIFRKTQLSKKQVETVEKKFLTSVATKIHGHHIFLHEDSFDPMVA